MRAHPIPHTVGILAGNVFAFTVVGFTIVVGRVTDEVIIPGLDGDGLAGRSLLSGLAAILLIGLVRGVSIMVRRYFNMTAVLRTRRTWRLAITDRYLDAPRSYYWSKPTGELLAHADADVETAMSMLMPLAFSVSVGALVVVSLISLLVVHPLFVLVAVLLFPTLAIINRAYVLAVEDPAARAQAIVGRVSAIAHESVDGIMVVKTIGRQDAEVGRFAAATADLRRERLEVYRRQSLFQPVIYSLPNLGILVLLLVGAWLISRDSVTIGELVQAMALFSILTMPVQILGYLFQQMPRSVVAMDRIDRVMDVEPELCPGSPPPVPELVPVVYEDVVFSYPPAGLGSPTPVLNGFSARIEAGESVALVGATGSGKSTLIALLAGVISPTAGKITLGGVDVDDLGVDGTASVVAPVFQETFLFADTVRENLTLGRSVPDPEVERVLHLVAADRFVAELPKGIDTPLGERGVTLSGGQRQRLAIARALLRRPGVLALDDSTSAVDPTIEAEILANLRAHRGRTLIVVAHRLATIRLADRILFLDDGRAVADGTHECLLDIPGYAALIRAYEEAVT
ncbi:MAG: ABC transporter ATP-binding protein [Actinomycetota bacterium]|nr:ABC transporter ATP-binding protein [Actinomycetota bacterium]